MKIKILNKQIYNVSVSAIKKLVKYVLLEERIEEQKIEVSIVLVDNITIKKLNRKYLGHNRITDVISFPMHEGLFKDLHAEILGDVVVSVEQAKKQAKRYQHSFKEEFWLYLIHGLQHLLGYEDDAPINAKKMHKRGMELLAGYIK